MLTLILLLFIILVEADFQLKTKICDLKFFFPFATVEIQTHALSLTHICSTQLGYYCLE